MKPEPAKEEEPEEEAEEEEEEEDEEEIVDPKETLEEGPLPRVLYSDDLWRGISPKCTPSQRVHAEIPKDN